MESVERTIVVPGQKFLSTEEAAKWLGVREDLFLEVMKHHNIGTVKAWKGKNMWTWATVWFAEELIKEYESEN